MGADFYKYGAATIARWDIVHPRRSAGPGFGQAAAAAISSWTGRAGMIHKKSARTVRWDWSDSAFGTRHRSAHATVWPPDFFRALPQQRRQTAALVD